MKYSFRKHAFLLEFGSTHIVNHKHTVFERKQFTRINVSDFAPLSRDHSFLDGITARQRCVFNRLATAIGVSGLCFPSITAFGLSWVFFAIFASLILWRLFLILVGAAIQLAPSRTTGVAMSAGEHPTYTVMVAAYQEAGLMEQLARALSKLDWPQNRMEILLLLEADDLDTRNAASRAKFPSGTKILLVPPGGPRTKPNALNYGLKHASGEYLVIYDVEDLPAPSQIKKAHAVFELSGPATVCLQARLAADNIKPGWLAAQWALEYDVQFGLLLTGTAICRLPVLLGGTSNHFRTQALRKLGGWDAWNVTEDADLGMRIARSGQAVRRLNCVTYEDAPASLKVWLPQRSRWLKGYLQTWLVLMRRPRETLRNVGLGRFIAIQASLGGAILAPLFHLPLALLVIAISASDDLDLGLIGMSLLIGGYAVSFLGDLCAPGRWTRSRLAAMLTKPLYWPLLSLAAYRAVWALAERPYFWAKTPHEPRLTEPRPCSTGSSAQPSP